MFDRRDFLKTSALAGAGVLLPEGFSTAPNRIVEENRRPGTTHWQLYSISQQGEVEGYASATSVNAGESIQFHVRSTEPSFRIQIFRLGWYGGLGGRAMTEQLELPGLLHSLPSMEPGTGMVECTWPPSLSLTIPGHWISGGYLAKLTAPVSRKEKWIPFIVREDGRRSDFLFQSSVTTSHAYNNWGGKSLYEFNSSNAQPASKISLNRPYVRGSGSGDFVHRWEYNMIRFLEREGYDVRYLTNIDTHARPWLLQTARAFLSVGHDEYWSWQMREHVTMARDSGIHLGFFSANTCYWKIRFEPGFDGTPERTIVAYKERAYTADPMRDDPRSITNTWRHHPTGLPEERLIGVMYVDSQIDGDIVVTEPDHWVYGATGLRYGERLPGLLGYEVDRVFGQGPEGVEVVARSPYVRTDNGATGWSDMTCYRAPSGAYVFATGSIQWSWGLDAFNDGRRTSRHHPAAEQITRNVLDRFSRSSGRRRAARS